MATLRGRRSQPACLESSKDVGRSTPLRCRGEEQLGRIQLVAEPNHVEPANHLRTYAVLDYPKHAVHVTCHHLKALQPHSGGGSMRTFLHHKRPTVFVHVVGRIVAVEEKEKKVIWLVDDGSGVVAVHHKHNPRSPIQSMDVQQRTTPMDNGKKRMKEQDRLGGIPLEYLRPRTPPSLPTHRQTAQAGPSTISNVQFEKSIRHLSVSSLVCVVGRVDVWFQQELIVCVDRIISPGRSRDDNTIRDGREGYIEALNNPNDEVTHMLDALQLSAGVYSEDFTLSTPPAPLISRLTRPLQDWPMEQGQLPEIEPRMRLRYLRTPPKDKELKQTDTSRSVTDVKERRSTTAISAKPMAAMPRTSSPQRHTRRLRDYRKLPDHQLTDQLLRIYVQEHISDYCVKAFPGTSDEAQVSKGSSIVVGFNSSSDEERSRKKHKNQKPAVCNKSSRVHRDVLDLPPAFTISYLLRVTGLRGMAYRVVQTALRGREARRRRLHGARPASLHRRSSGVADEHIKVQRLFEAVIRNVVLDGMIVVADVNVSPRRPFDGRKPSEDVLCEADPDRLLDWDDLHGSIGATSGRSCASQELTNQMDTSLLRWHGQPNGHQEAYQMVTPALLAQPVAHVLGLQSVLGTAQSRAQPREARLGTGAHATIVGRCKPSTPSSPSKRESINRALSTPAEHVMDRVRSLDDRWRHIRVDSIAEAMVYLQGLVHW